MRVGMRKRAKSIIRQDHQEEVRACLSVVDLDRIRCTVRRSISMEWSPVQLNSAERFILESRAEAGEAGEYEGEYDGGGASRLRGFVTDDW